MSKPIDEAHVMKDACPKCESGVKNSDMSLVYFCRIHILGYFSQPCTLSDWARCPFNPTEKPGTKSYGEPRNPGVEVKGR
jgi:hypothetical protein